MMTEVQLKNIDLVYKHLLAKEDRGWDALDDCIDHLDFLDNDQLHREVDVINEKHTNISVSCSQDHKKEKCFIPHLVKASTDILEYYKETNKMSDIDRYILQYYLAFQYAGMIILGEHQ